MQLIDDAGRLWHRLWCIRFAAVAGACGGADLYVQLFQPEHASIGWKVGALLATIASAVARVVFQPRLRDHG